MTFCLLPLARKRLKYLCTPQGKNFHVAKQNFSFLRKEFALLEENFFSIRVDLL